MADEEGNSAKCTESIVLKTFIYTGGDPEEIPNDVNNLVIVKGLSKIPKEKWKEGWKKLCHLVIADPEATELPCSDTKNFPELKILDLSQAAGIVSVAHNFLLRESSSVETILLPRKLEAIERFGIFKCHNLKMIVIPPTAKIIEEKAFGDHANLTTVIFEGSRTFCLITANWKEIDALYGQRYESARSHRPFNRCDKLSEIQWPKRTFDILLWPRLFWHFWCSSGALTQWGLSTYSCSTNRNSCLFNFLCANVADLFHNEKHIAASWKKSSKFQLVQARKTVDKFLINCPDPGYKQMGAQFLVERILDHMHGPNAAERKQAVLQLAFGKDGDDDKTPSNKRLKLGEEDKKEM